MWLTCPTWLEGGCVGCLLLSSGPPLLEVGGESSSGAGAEGVRLNEGRRAKCWRGLLSVELTRLQGEEHMHMYIHVYMYNPLYMYMYIAQVCCILSMKCGRYAHATCTYICTMYMHTCTCTVHAYMYMYCTCLYNNCMYM